MGKQSERKKARRKKRQSKRLFIPSSAEAFDGEIKRKAPSEDEVMARKLGEKMTELAILKRQRGPKYKMFHCPVCNMAFCINAFGNDEFCSTCWVIENKDKIEKSGGIFAGCGCTHYGERTCQSCGGC